MQQGLHLDKALWGQGNPVQTRSCEDSEQGTAAFSGQDRAALPQLHPMMLLLWQH